MHLLQPKDGNKRKYKSEEKSFDLQIISKPN